MKKAVAVILVIALITFAGLVTVKMNHRDPLDLTKDELPFNRMTLPPHEVLGSIYMDGGSVWIRISEQDGTVTHLIFPYDAKTHGYPSAIYGVRSIDDRGAIPLKNPARAREIAIELLDHYGDDEGAYTAEQYLLANPRSVRGKIRTLFFDY